MQPLRWHYAKMCGSPRTEYAWRKTPYAAYVAWTSHNRVIMACDLYCCFLPQYEALRICCSAFPITTKWCCDQDVKVVLGSAFTQRMFDRCGLLQKVGDVVATTPLALRWNAWFTTNEYAWRKTPYTVYVAWTSNNRLEWSWCVNSIVACCHSAKLCAHATLLAFQSLQSKFAWAGSCLAGTGSK